MPVAPPFGENRLLKRLDAGDRAALKPHLKLTPMVRGTVLHVAMNPIDYVYFPLSGMISLLAVMSTGEQIETGIVGREGVVGASIGTFGPNSFGQSTVQMPGQALRISRDAFMDRHQASAGFRNAVNQYQALILLQAQQSAACHALHTVEQRLCRWVLQSSDVIESDEINLTQEFLSHMLGVHRPAVSIAATALQARGLIKYTRGKIAIVNRPGLKKQACECYAIVQGYMAKAVDAPTPPKPDRELGRAAS